MEDAEVLKELYETIKQNSKADYAGIIEQRASYPYLYHLSQIRENLVSFLPFDKDMRVLECNPECGALTGKLLAMTGGVTVLAESELQEKILRERFMEPQEREKLDIRRLLPEHGRFDAILIAGHFYRWEKQLPVLRELLAPGGKLYVADANRIGLKYLAGCQEEYCGRYFTGIDGYPDAAAVGRFGRSYSRAEYTRLLQEAGFGGLTFYYPYPDHKFPSVIYSDEWLPQKGELAEGRSNYDRDRVACFNERVMFDSLLEEGVFQTFSNSFLIEAVQEG
ncbi:hypothetical protein [Roseburia hominis]|uniref:hypothetical protein n=1 Tax=Roseburia hominis TaxID=301301 RepID=UPI003AB86E14